MAKPEKAQKPKRPAAKSKPLPANTSSKPKKPPAKAQLSSEFVHDSSDEDDDTPAPPVIAKDLVATNKETFLKKREAAVKTKAPKKKVKPNAPVVEVSSEDESSSEESDKSESESSKTDRKPAEAVAERASASEGESETEKEKEDSSNDESDSSSGISVVAPTNKGKVPATDSRPRPTTAPVSHVSETRPASAFRPPHSFKPTNSSTSKLTELFSSQATSAQQIWHITAPANIPLSSLKELALDKLVEGASVMTYRDVDYSFTTDDTARPATAIFLPSERGFEPQPTRVQKTVHLRQVVKLPAAPQSKIGMPSSVVTTIPQQPHFEVQKRTKREQPKGLKMRYRPSGAGTGDLGHIGSSGDEEPACERAKASSTAPNVGKKRKERDDDVTSGEKKKKKKKEKHRTNTEEAMELVPSSSVMDGSAKSSGVETPKKKDKEKKKKRQKERA